MKTSFVATVAALLAIVGGIQSAHNERQDTIVFTNINSSTVWHVGSSAQITYDASRILPPYTSYGADCSAALEDADDPNRPAYSLGPRSYGVNCKEGALGADVPADVPAGAYRVRVLAFIVNAPRPGPPVANVISDSFWVDTNSTN